MKLWQGNIFTHVCQSFCSQRGLCPNMHYRSMIRGSLSGGSLSGGGLCPRGSLSRGSLSWRDLCPEGLCPGGSLSCGGLSGRWEELCPGGLSRETPQTDTPHTVTCGRYASYWKVFLSLMFSSSPPLSVIRS